MIHGATGQVCSFWGWFLPTSGIKGGGHGTWLAARSEHAAAIASRGVMTAVAGSLKLGPGDPR